MRFQGAVDSCPFFIQGLKALVGRYFWENIIQYKKNANPVYISVFYVTFAAIIKEK